MLRIYFKLALRNLLSNKLVTGINIFGLSIAVGCSIVVFLFLQNHWTMDNFHRNGDRIFIAEYTVDKDGGVETWGSSPMPLGPALEADFPQVERAVRIELQGAEVYLGNRSFDELVYFADPGYFDMFTFPLKSGRASALTEPDAVILSADAAEKYFQKEDALGKEITIVFENQVRKVFTVKGVALPFPENTGFRFDVLTGFNTLAAIGAPGLTDWSTHTRGTFVQLRQAGDVEVLSKKMDRYVALHNAANPELQMKALVFDNLRHPNPGAYDVVRRPAEAAHPLVTAIFSLIALLMMALSCFNYINISLGHVGKRLKEIGIRKTIGGRKMQLVIQFMSENLLLCFFALLLGLALAQTVLTPFFNAIMVSRISLDLGANAWLWVFSSKETTIYVIRRSRGHDVPEEILGAFDGYLIVDGLKSYDVLDVAKGRCNGHLLRRCKELAQTLPKVQQKWAVALKELLQDALALAQQRDELAADVYAKRVARIEDRLDAWIDAVPTQDADVNRLVNHVASHRGEWLVFLHDAEVPATNNHAERMIRPAVITRKVGGCNKTLKGAAVHGVLASLIATCRQQGRRFLDLAKRLWTGDVSQAIKISDLPEPPNALGSAA